MALSTTNRWGGGRWRPFEVTGQKVDESRKARKYSSRNWPDDVFISWQTVVLLFACRHSHHLYHRKQRVPDCSACECILRRSVYGGVVESASAHLLYTCVGFPPPTAPHRSRMRRSILAEDSIERDLALMSPGFVIPACLSGACR